MTKPVECRYHGCDFTTAEFALLRSLTAGPSALNRRHAPARPNGYRPVHLIGVEFSSASRHVVAFEHEVV